MSSAYKTVRASRAGRVGSDYDYVQTKRLERERYGDPYARIVSDRRCAESPDDGVYKVTRAKITRPFMCTRASCESVNSHNGA